MNENHKSTAICLQSVMTEQRCPMRHDALYHDHVLASGGTAPCILNQRSRVTSQHTYPPPRDKNKPLVPP
jgi:hypothetical protein